MHAVWKYSVAAGNELLVLLAMADWADDAGYCFPSRRAISRKSRASLATVKRAIRQGMENGEVERVAKAGHTVPAPREWIGRTGFRPTNLYRITLLDRTELGSKRDQLTDRTGVKSDGQRGSRKAPQRGSNRTAPIRKYTSEDTSEDTSESTDRAGAPPQVPQNPDDNLRVITKIAHDVLDLLAETPDIDYGEVVETVKRHCATLNIAYWPGDVVQRAIESALYQRQRIGKASIIRSSAGEAAFRLSEPG